MVDGIRCSSLQVPDLAAASDWYAQFLETPPYLSDSEAVTFYLNGYLLTLRAGAPQARGAVTYWATQSLDAELERLRGLGAQVDGRIEVLDQYTRQAVFTDPFGNAVGVVQRSDPSELRARSQRAAEKIALRNVRTTLNELETMRDDPRLRRLVIAVIVVAVLGIAALVGGILANAPAQAPVNFTGKTG